MPQPCCGSSASVRRIKRSKVPCGSSMRSFIGFYLPISLLQVSIADPPVEVQGEGAVVATHSTPRLSSRSALAPDCINVEGCRLVQNCRLRRTDEGPGSTDRKSPTPV